MRNHGRCTRIACAMALLGTLEGTVVAGPHQHGGDVVVGRTAKGQLAVEVPVGAPTPLDAVDGFLRGWAGDEPGFMSLAEDEPDEGFFVLGQGAIVGLDLLSIDPALKVWSPGFVSALTAPGQSFVLGGATFDTHGTFHIDSTDPAFDPGQDVFSATFRVVDTGTTGYAASEPFALAFTPVPEPMTVLLFGVGALGIGGRRVLRVCALRRSR